MTNLLFVVLLSASVESHASSAAGEPERSLSQVASPKENAAGSREEEAVVRVDDP